MSDSSSSRSENATRWTSHYSDNFKGVPNKRSCTDCYCLVILLIFVSCWLAIGYYVYWNGDISRLAVPRDSMGRHCGLDEEVRDSPYLFFFDISKCVSLSIFLFGCPTKQMCVKKCPTENWFSSKIDSGSTSWANIQSKLICNDTEIIKKINSQEAIHKAISEERCASYYVASTPAFFHMCLPTFNLIKDGMAAGFDKESLEMQKVHNYFSDVYQVSGEIQEDLKKCWHFIILFVTVSLVACLFIILIMGIITRIVVWVTLMIVLIFLLYATVTTFIQYEQLAVIPENKPDTNYINESNLFGQIQWLLRQKQTWLVLFGISSICFTLFLLLVIFLRSRIGLAVMLIGEGSKAINRIKSTLCFPLVTRILQLLVIVWFLSVFLYINSLNNTVHTVDGLQNDLDCRCKTYKPNTWCLPHKFIEDCSSISKGGPCQIAKCKFSEERHPKLKTYLHLFNFFGLLWGLYFVTGLSRMILSFCFAKWYWTYNKYDLPFFTLFYSMFVTIRYHMGTVALGSFLIATLGFLRTLLEYMQRMLKQSDGLMTQCITWSLRSCFWCLQRFLIFISNNAYIMCSIMGSNFFSSAEEALSLITRNILRVVVLDKVLDFLMLVGKISVTVFVGLLSYFTFSRSTLDLHHPLVPTALVSIVVWIVSSSFFGVYVVAVDTLFLSFVKDVDMNDGSQTKPYYMTRKFKYMLKEEAKMKKNAKLT